MKDSVGEKADKSVHERLDEKQDGENLLLMTMSNPPPYAWSLVLPATVPATPEAHIIESTHLTNDEHR